MQNLLTNKTVSLTELRDPAKVLQKAGNTPVAVLNRNRVVGYFVPSAAVEDITSRHATLEETKKVLEVQKKRMAPALDYLKDK